ncbi:MAG: glycosyltransferase family 9 protein [Burkholderiales bacterium]|nr:glycosyltransferase family 9 protein [Burkholderiales bacterium]
MRTSRLTCRLLVAAWYVAQAWRPRRPPTQIKRVLILHRHLLGDTLMLTGLLAKLRAQYPAAELIMAGSGNFGSLYAGRPYGVDYLQFDIKRAESLLAIRARGPYDLAILPAENRWGWTARALGARWVVGFGDELPARRNRSLDEARPYSSVPTAWTDTAAELIDGPLPAPYRVSDWPAPAYQPFDQPAGRYCVLHIGTSASLKLWAPARWQALAAQLAAAGLTPVWSGGPGEEKLIAECDPHARWASYAGQLDLAQAWHLVSHAALLVSVDTSIAHLGRIVGTPTVALFGQGSALLCGAGHFWRETPFEAISIDVPCRDQIRNFARLIPWIRRCERLPGTAAGQCARAICMEGIETDAVFAAAMALIDQAD